jgi:hypothetical protein
MPRRNIARATLVIGSLLAFSTAACTSDDEGGGSPGGGSPGGGSSSGGSSSGGSSSGGSSGGLPSDVCPLPADHAVELRLGAADLAAETRTSGDATEWRLAAEPGVTLESFSPGETVSLTLRLEDAPIAAARSGRAFYVTIRARDGVASTFAQKDPETETASEGTLTIGPWQLSLSVNAGGKPVALTLGGIAINPDPGQDVRCFSVRTTIPAQVNKVTDQSLVDVTASGPMVIDEVRLSISGDPPEEPFGLTVGAD